ncbi:MAG: ABC transporter ATP-binding protein [Betaproteobacteria bacterium]|nr:MAG: ABC transporter ATP-binding protein [Betaproteobacteria bacterium]
MTPVLALERVSCTFLSRDDPSERYTAVSDTTLVIGEGEFVSVVGPTGCGKTTLLNVAAGLLKPSTGTVRLEFRGMAREEAFARGEEWLARVGLAGFGKRYPHQLSGGMRKRVALAQMFILNPQILLMDEPFSALDIQTRQLMENGLLELWSVDRKSVVFITHDLEEAISLADRVVVLSAGPASHPIGDYAIDLPRPRDVADIRLAPRFIEIHAKIWRAMKEEVLKGYVQQQRQ